MGYTCIWSFMLMQKTVGDKMTINCNTRQKRKHMYMYIEGKNVLHLLLWYICRRQSFCLLNMFLEEEEEEEEVYLLVSLSDYWIHSIIND